MRDPILSMSVECSSSMMLGLEPLLEAAARLVREGVEDAGPGFRHECGKFFQHDAGPREIVRGRSSDARKDDSG